MEKMPTAHTELGFKSLCSECVPKSNQRSAKIDSNTEMTKILDSLSSKGKHFNTEKAI